jgi:hypothetical protein
MINKNMMKLAQHLYIYIYIKAWMHAIIIIINNNNNNNNKKEVIVAHS